MGVKRRQGKSVAALCADRYPEPIARTLIEARIDPVTGKAYARAGLEVDANGVAGGLFLTSNGELVDLLLALDRLTIIRPGADPNDLSDDDKLFFLDGDDLYGNGVDPVAVRRQVGMVFQKPNPFPKSIYDNVAYGPRVAGQKGNMDEVVEQSLGNLRELGWFTRNSQTKVE